MSKDDDTTFSDAKSDQDLQGILASMARAIRQMAERQSKQEAATSSTVQNTALLLGTFLYDPDQDPTYKNWFARNRSILEESSSVEKLRSQLLLKALGPNEYSRLLSRLSPARPEEKDYAELVELLTKVFGPSKSVLRRRHDILCQAAPLSASSNPEEIIDWANLKGDQFEFGSMDVEKFKIFLAINYAAGPSFKTLRSIMLKAVDDRPELTVAELREVLIRFAARTRDSTSDNSVDQSSSIKQVHKKLTRQSPKPHSEPRPQGTYRQNSTCGGCGGDHTRHSCEWRTAKCRRCGKKGHLASKENLSLGVSSLRATSRNRLITQHWEEA
ncbi:uncharacterized protein LOC108863823 [Galendromus occidentalis]|uniref:Uncharacterized protein LOC108863823 n=1 Tax=Galendromus occidentalis TaxID=34638 RepID=A0AAJ7L2T3_9ACAR|nr:uncharacterized protein LOC108863823 [Galendromus occidentalis]